MSEQESANNRLKSKKSGFFGMLWKALKLYFISVGVFYTFVPLIIIILIFSSLRSSSTDHEATPTQSYKIADHSFVELKWVGPLLSFKPSIEDMILRSLFKEDAPLNMAEQRTLLRRLKHDPRIEGVLIELRDLQASAVLINELRDLLKELRAAEKEVIIWAVEPSTQLYYLASVASKIILAPAGGVEILGSAFQLVYFGEALRKLGVDFEVIRAGKYKAAFEPFVLNTPSAPTLEMYDSMQDSLLEFYADEIATQRQKTLEATLGWFKKSIFTTQNALDNGLVDQIGFYHEVKESVSWIDDNQNQKTKRPFIAAKKYLKRSDAIDDDLAIDSKDGIGLIMLKGEIVGDHFSVAAEEYITPNLARKQIEWAIETPAVKSVVMYIDSPGGSATASDLIWADVSRLAAAKPVTILMGSVCASGGYYIAAAGSKIVADPSTITGSIGVIGALPKFPRAEEKYGVSFHLVSSTDAKSIYDPGQKLTPQGREIIGNGIDAAYNLFLKRVANGRKMSTDQVHDLAQGRVYTGIQAFDNKLVDSIGGYNEAFRLAKEAADLNPEKLYPLLTYTGDSIDLMGCLKNASAFLECMREFDSKLFIHKSITKWNSDPLTLKMQKIKQRLQMIREERTLALWAPLTGF